LPPVLSSSPMVKLCSLPKLELASLREGKVGLSSPTASRSNSLIRHIYKLENILATISYATILYKKTYKEYCLI